MSGKRVYFGLDEALLPCPHAYGYTVEVIDADTGRLIHSYSAGNHKLDSQGYVSVDSPMALDRETLKQYALSTADEIAAEYNADL